MSGGVDGAIVTPFFVPSAKKAGLVVIFDLSTINATFANQIVIVNDNLIKEKARGGSGACPRFVRRDQGLESWLRSDEGLSEKTVQIARC